MAAAMVLGTALTAFGPDVAAAETRGNAVNDLGRYCTTCWRNARLPAAAWDDCTQEVFRRLLERVPAIRWRMALTAEGDERRELLRAIDAVKKRTQRARRFADGADQAPDPKPTVLRELAEDRELVSKAAEELLSKRQQRVLQLSFEGWSVPEIAEDIGVGVERVSDEKYKAIRKLRRHLAG